MQLNFILVSALLLLLVQCRSVFAQSKTVSQNRQPESEASFTSELWQFSPKKENGKDFYSLRLNRQKLRQIWEREPSEFSVSVPEKSGKIRKLTFSKSDIISPDFEYKTSDGRILKGKEFSGLHYHMQAETDGHIGGISFREDGFTGFAAIGNSNISIGEKEPGSGKYVISFDEDQKMPAWNCDAEMLSTDRRNPENRGEAGDKAVSTICKTTRIYLECDRDVYQKSGNNLATASNFVTGLFNVVAQIYAVEGITIQIGGIFQWTTTDPYAGISSSSTILSNFVANRAATSVNADLLHLVSTRSSNLGGIAYISVLCYPVYRHGFSNVYYQYSALPAYSWSVYCLSHELGHNFGSNHTQWCGWTLPNGTLGRIDSCYAGEGSCGTVTKARVGTIMSYCHLSSGINFNLGFGPLPQKAIRTGLTNASCITSGSCLGIPSVKADSLVNKNNSYILTVSVPASHNATSWSLREGNTTIQTGTLTGNTAFSTDVSISGKANGSYTYSVVISNGTASSSGTSINVSVAVPVVVPPVPTGSCTANGLMAWFDSNGKLRFRFSISSPCTTYTVQVCRYNLTNPSVVPSAGAIPVACGVRNGMSAYAPTTAEWTQGFIERVADPQPANRTTSGMGSFWYSVDVTCNSGGSCTTTNRTRTYIFVPGI